ncbi:hypothetical protein BGX33_001918 [Mortierella sp. NVP41]|nr:hypothetical protein BGX33_001918 [Mortierella sp. NVP41]
MPSFSSNATHQSQLQSSQTAPVPSNSPVNNRRIFINSEGQPLHICVSRTVANLDNVEFKIKKHGGIPTHDERTAAIKLAAPGRSYQEPMFSVAWVDDCVKIQRLLNTSPYRLGTAISTKKTPFTAEDDRLLTEFVNSKKQDHAFINGNIIYEHFAEMYNRHSAQSWRERAVDVLKLTSGPSPYEASKEKREAARRQQERQRETERLRLLEQQQPQRQQQGVQKTRTSSTQQPIKPPPTAATSRITDTDFQVIGSDSEEEESKQESSQHFARPSQQPLMFIDIESSDEEDKFHKAEMDRRRNPDSQLSAFQLLASQQEDRKITPSQKVQLDKSLSPSPSPEPVLNRPSPVAEDPIQDQDGIQDEPFEYNDEDYTDEPARDNDLDDPFVDYNNSDSPTETRNSHTSPVLHNGNSSDPFKVDEDHSSPVEVGEDDSLSDPFGSNDTPGANEIMDKDDDSDYSEPKRSKPSPRPKRQVKTLRTRPATLSPKKAESPESLKDSVLRRSARRSLPNRSWGQDALADENGVTTTPLPIDNTEEIDHTDERRPAGTPTKDDLVAAQGQPSLPAWRNSPQAHLSIPGTFSLPLQDVPDQDTQQDVSTKDDLNEVASAMEELQEEPVMDDWQDEPAMDEPYDETSGLDPEDDADVRGSQEEADASGEDNNSELTDEDDITIEQKILQKTRPRYLSPSEDAAQEPQEQRSPSSTPAYAERRTSKAQEVSDSEDDHLVYELPAKLLVAHTPSQRQQAQWSPTVRSTGPSFKATDQAAVYSRSEREESLNISGPVSSASEGEEEEDADDAVGADVGVPREVNDELVEAESSSVHINVSESQSVVVEHVEPEGHSVQITVSESRSVAETIQTTTVVHETDAPLLGEEDQEDSLAVSEVAVESGQEEEEEVEIGQQLGETANEGHLSAHVVPAVAPTVVPVVQEVSSPVPDSRDVVLDYYSGEGVGETAERRMEREQLLLYLRDLYRKEIRTLMLHELVPALRSIDILDACSGNLKLARVFIDQGMTEEIQSQFWTRVDDYMLFSTKNEDVMGLLKRRSAVELISRTGYLTKTRQEAKQFEVAPGAMEASGLLKRAGGRFHGRESKRPRLGGDGDQQ